MRAPAHRIEDGFAKQRRSLVVTSLVLFFYQTSGLVIESINVFGNTLHFSQAPRIALVFWVVWFYFFLRYYQYFRDVQDKGLANAYYAKLHVLVRRVAQKQFKQIFVPDEKFAEAKGPLQFTFPRMDVQTAYPEFWELELDVDVSYQTETGVSSHRYNKYKLNLSPRALVVPKLRSLLHVIVNTRLATEYGLPFLIALVPPLYQLAIWFGFVRGN